jgi:hypothetical protein
LHILRIKEAYLKEKREGMVTRARQKDTFTGRRKGGICANLQLK